MLHVRLYLSSFRVGDHPRQLLDLIGRPGRIAVIANAMDHAPDVVRRDAVAREVADLGALGLDADEVDLRDHSGDREGVESRLAEYPALWLRGGNAFMLRAAMALSGADQAVVALLRRDGLVYAGYSAGPCVLAPSLRGLELVDYPDEVLTVHGLAPVYDGLGVLDYAFAPHFESPGHPETEDIGRLVELYRNQGTPHRTLHDGEALVVSGAETRLV